MLQIGTNIVLEVRSETTFGKQIPGQIVWFCVFPLDLVHQLFNLLNSLLIFHMFQQGKVFFDKIMAVFLDEDLHHVLKKVCETFKTRKYRGSRKNLILKPVTISVLIFSTINTHHVHHLHMLNQVKKELRNHTRPFVITASTPALIPQSWDKNFASCSSTRDY